MSPYLVLRKMLETRLANGARAWFQAAANEIGDGASDARFAALFSSASRHALDRTPLAPTETERQAAENAVSGWDPERWTLLEALRVALLLSRTDLDDERGDLAIGDLFTYADEGEQRALYRSLALLTEPERFAWRAAEGCRTNMTSVFESVVLDTPFPSLYFDDLSFRQAVIKAIFVGVPLSRMWGLDDRLDEELARMALDLADERRSAHRSAQPDLWLCLGTHGGTRALESIEAELDPSNSHTLGRRAAVYALARAGKLDRLRTALADETEPGVRASMEDALAGNTGQAAFRSLEL